MKTFYDVLRELIDHKADDGGHVLSLYLDISGDGAGPGAFAESEIESWLYREGDRGAVDEAVDELAEATLDEVEGEVAAARAEGYDGLALFRGVGPSLRHSVRLRFPFENQLEIGNHPYLRQLLYYAEEYEQTVVVTVQGSEVLLSDIHVGDVVATHKVKPTHGRTVLEEAAADLHRRMRDQPHVHLIVSGDASGAIEASLDDEIRGRIIDRIASAFDPSDPRFLRAVHHCLQDYERRSEAKGMAELVAGRDKGEPLAVGLAETVAAINRGKIHTLFIQQGLGLRGWICDACNYMGPLPAPPACVACGASVSKVQLEDHLLDQAAACGAEIETVRESADLARMGGVAARLHAPLTPEPPRVKVS